MAAMMPASAEAARPLWEWTLPELERHETVGPAPDRPAVARAHAMSIRSHGQTQDLMLRIEDCAETIARLERETAGVLPAAAAAATGTGTGGEEDAGGEDDEVDPAMVAGTCCHARLGGPRPPDRAPQTMRGSRLSGVCRSVPMCSRSSGRCAGHGRMPLHQGGADVSGAGARNWPPTVRLT
jgi:hypothetical protein